MKNKDKIITALMVLIFSASAFAVDFKDCCPATDPVRDDRSVMNQEMEPIKPIQRPTFPSYLSEPDAIILASEVAVPSLSIAEMIVGRVPGVQVSGTYMDYRIRIRGAQGPPLIVLDQLQFNGYDDERVNDLLLSIPAADVESIEIIKSLGQAAIYGPNAGNGVIKINTKR